MSWMLRWDGAASRQARRLGNDAWLAVLQEMRRCCGNPYHVGTQWLNPSGTQRLTCVGDLEIRFQLRQRNKELIVTDIQGSG